MSVKTEKVGSRIYIVGNTYPIKDRIKAIGGHWDTDRKQWWVGTAKSAEVESLIANAPAVQDTYVPQPIGRDARVYRKVRYTSKAGKVGTYYVVAEGRERYRLTTLDTKFDFWALHADCETVKVYQPRVRRGFYGRPDSTDYTTLGRIADFIAESRRDERGIAAGNVPDGYCVDLEDGVVKRRSECDIPEN